MSSGVGQPPVIFQDLDSGNPYCGVGEAFSPGSAPAGRRLSDDARADGKEPAEVFGVADRIGSLQAGRDGNVVIWGGDPFELSTVAEHVYVKGREYTAPDRQQLLTERYKHLPAGQGLPVIR